MGALPREIVRVLRIFEDVFSERVWDWVLVLVETLVPVDEPVVIGMDETIERRRGAKIAAKGIYRDPVRSSKSHFVKASGLRWISMQVLAEVPWAGRIWGLPFLTVLAPSERYSLKPGRRHKTLPEWGRQMIRQLRRWLPERALVVVADSTYAVLELLADATRLRQPMTMVPACAWTRPLRSGHDVGAADRPLARRWDRARRWRPPRARPSGTIPATRPSRSAGCCCAIR